MTPFANRSSFLEGCSYDKDLCCLTVHFWNGKEYKYADVGIEEYKAFLNTDSPGIAFGAIKKQFKPYIEEAKND